MLEITWQNDLNLFYLKAAKVQKRGLVFHKRGSTHRTVMTDFKQLLYTEQYRT